MELRCGHITVSISPRERSHEPPPSLLCNVTVVVSHSTGAFRYQADDIYIELSGLTAFDSDLEALISGTASEASLSCMSNYFRLRVTRNGSAVGIAVDIEEYVPNVANPKLSANGAEDNGELLSRWREQLNHALCIDD